MLELAPRLCTPKQLVLFPDHPQVALNQYMASSNKREAFLPYDEADGFVFYLWVQGVLPSFNGKKPPIRVRPVNLERNPSLVGTFPEWFCPELTKFTQIRLEKGKKRKELEAERLACCRDPLFAPFHHNPRTHTTPNTPHKERFGSV
ncbi:hypothetical protein B0H13DRAFT_2354247 [Mycena leptocephala]|nr:hypothetical protein B0H13DRAFT_2354247 [Mycena leptocephala]